MFVVVAGDQRLGGCRITSHLEEAGDYEKGLPSEVISSSQGAVKMLRRRSRQKELGCASRWNCGQVRSCNGW